MSVQCVVLSKKKMGWLARKLRFAILRQVECASQSTQPLTIVKSSSMVKYGYSIVAYTIRLFHRVFGRIPPMFHTLYFQDHMEYRASK